MVEGRTISVAEAALRAGLQKETVRRYIAQGLLPARKLPNGYYRILEQDLNRLLEPVGKTEA